MVNQQAMLSEGIKSYKCPESWSIISGIPKKHKPEKFDGTSTVIRRTIHMDSYPEDANDYELLLLAARYRTSAAYMWRIAFKNSEEEKHVELRERLEKR